MEEGVYGKIETVDIILKRHKKGWSICIKKICSSEETGKLTH